MERSAAIEMAADRQLAGIFACRRGDVHMGMSRRVKVGRCHWHVLPLLAIGHGVAMGQVSIPASRCMSSAEFAKIKPEWQTFKSAEFSSNGFRHVINKHPPDGTPVLIYVASSSGPTFFQGMVRCVGGKFSSIQFNPSSSPPLGSTWSYWLPLKAPTTPIPN